MKWSTARRNRQHCFESKTRRKKVALLGRQYMYLWTFTPTSLFPVFHFKDGPAYKKWIAENLA